MLTGIFTQNLAPSVNKTRFYHRDYNDWNKIQSLQRLQRLQTLQR